MAVRCRWAIFVVVGFVCLTKEARAISETPESACQRYNRSDSVFIGEVVDTTPQGNPWETWELIGDRLRAEQCADLEPNSKLYRECDARVRDLAFQETWRRILVDVEPPALADLSRPFRNVSSFRKRDLLPRRVRVKAVEILKGGEPSDLTFTDWVIRDGRSKLSVGEKYIFHRGSNRPSQESDYHGAQSLDEPGVQEEIELSRDMRGSVDSTVVHGRVNIEAREMQSLPSGIPADGFGPLEGATIRVELGSFRSTAQTGVGGVYTIKNLAPGEYSVYADYPPAGIRSDPVKVQIAVGECAEAGFFLNVDALYRSRIEGNLLKPDGSPHPGPFIDLVPVGESIHKLKLSSVLRVDGRFALYKLVEGKYLLGLGIRTPPSATSRHTGYLYPYARYYYPGVEDPSQAVPIEVKEGEAAGPFEWTGPEPLESWEISGVVQWDGGEPAGWIQVDLIDTEFDKVVDRMASRPDGTFRMFGLEGRDYRLKLQSMPASGDSSGHAEVELGAISKAALEIVLQRGN